MAQDDTPPEQAPAPTPEEDTPPRTPPLSRDAWRGLFAMVITSLPQLGLVAWVNISGQDAPGLEVYAFSLVLITFYAIYLALTWWVFGRLDPARLRAVIAASNHASRRRFDRLTGMDATSWVLGSVGSALVVVAYTLIEPATRTAPLALGLTGVMVLLAWATMQISATLVLLREDVAQPFLAFPDDGPKGLHDYGYVATQVLSTFATSDVGVTTTAGRRAVTTLAIAALVFNTVVVALLVSAFLGLATA